MIKYEYEPGMCHLLHYNGLYPVKYEGVPGHYKKIEMACDHGDGKCKEDCEVFKNTPDIKDVDKEWLLKDELYKSASAK